MTKIIALKDIKESLGIGECRIINFFENSLSCYWVLQTENGALFVKLPYLSDPTLGLNIQEKRWVDYVSKTFPAFRWRKKADSIKDLIAKEARTLQLWNESNIDSPKLFHANSKLISTLFVEGTDYRALLEKGMNKRDIDRLCETYLKTKGLALQKRNPYYLHSDPKLKNFLKCEDKCLAIDPANLVNTSISVEELAEGLSLYFLYGAYTLNSERANIEKLVSRMIASFDREDRLRLSELNLQLCLERAKFPDITSYRYTFNNYSAENIELTQKLFRR
ncbi:MAG: hypothetical protein QME12_07045 [Nanoarchaeota archaeon]|nr:hypothetical protein [Nanoarchaeota archaeon]